jgi:hypothetical protein
MGDNKSQVEVTGADARGAPRAPTTSATSLPAETLLCPSPRGCSVRAASARWRLRCAAPIATAVTPSPGAMELPAALHCLEPPLSSTEGTPTTHLMRQVVSAGVVFRAMATRRRPSPTAPRTWAPKRTRRPHQPGVFGRWGSPLRIRGHDRGRAQKAPKQPSPQKQKAR